MLKLILKMPKGADANLLMTSALALAQYKLQRHNHFGVDTYNAADYVDVDLVQFEPERVYGYGSDRDEYEVDASILDPFLVETLAEMQAVVPFEMYFENRGKYDPARWMYEHPEWTGDIEDAALHRLFWEGAA